MTYAFRANCVHMRIPIYNLYIYQFYMYIMLRSAPLRERVQVARNNRPFKTYIEHIHIGYIGPAYRQKKDHLFLSIFGTLSDQ